MKKLYVSILCTSLAIVLLSAIITNVVKPAFAASETSQACKDAAPKD